MQSIDSKFNILPEVKINITIDDVVEKMQTGGGGSSAEILKTAQNALDKIKDIWNPAAGYAWFEFSFDSGSALGRIAKDTTTFLDVNLGHSSKFLINADQVLVSVYTAGQELEKEYNKVSREGDMLTAFILDIIGRIVLEKTGAIIRQVVQKKANEFGWGVSPFLSPGSVNGWKLEAQKTLCTLLPLEDINVQIREDGILMPFKSISCLIGIGPEYKEANVGNTCQVCSQKDNCEMKSK